VLVAHLLVLPAALVFLLLRTDRSSVGGRGLAV